MKRLALSIDPAEVQRLFMEALREALLGKGGNFNCELEFRDDDAASVGGGTRLTIKVSRNS